MGCLALVCYVCLLFVISDINATEPLDVVILLDSSDDHRSSNFAEEKAFAKKLTQQLWENGNRIGLYTFGSESHRYFTLNTYYQEANAVTAIRYMWYSSGAGDLNNALHFTLDDAFTSENGERECVPNVLIVLTHSGLPNTTFLAGISRKIKEHSVSVVAIDMVKGTHDHGLQTVTGNRSRIIECQNFHVLQTLPHAIVSLVKSDSLPTGCGTLTPWEPWSRCSVTCGNGLRFRIRRCNKDDDSEKDCFGERSEDIPCNAGVCTDPVDGVWSYWGSWGKCSRSCNNGTQRRRRTCDDPAPSFGGSACPGNNTQTRVCATWKCPDCTRLCPAGGHLSINCTYCECASITLFGRVMDNVGEVVQDANIYLDSQLFAPIAKTNHLGFFNASGVCIMNENIHISKDGYQSTIITPNEINLTHWKVNATLKKNVAPIFTANPETKIRMTGQDVTFCCSANGYPIPTEYKWYKNGLELENEGTNGTLILTGLTLQDAGIYKCTTETDAGVSQSADADLIVEAQGADTCADLMSKLETLPPTCYVAGDATRNSTFDVKTCGKGKCITPRLIDNGTCSDWWPAHCCDADETEQVEISCDSFSYKSTVIKSCKCQMCIEKTTISGRAFGRVNGTVDPLQLGSIYLNGESKGRTTMSGYFMIDVRSDIKRAIITLNDDLFGILVDHIKIVNIEKGVDTQISIIIPHRPKPVAFNSEIGTDILLGTDSDGIPPAGSISIPEGAMVTEDGNIFTGKANIAIQYMDPRNLDDIIKASGEFVCSSPNGEELPLRTYGTFLGSMTDDQGNTLLSNKPFKVSVDSSLFNISQDEHGNADVALWHFDPNKGVWIDQGKMHFASGSSGRRKLLSNVVTGSLSVPSISHMDPYSYSYHTETILTRVVRSWRGNIDRKIYKTIQVKDSKLKDGVCFVSVSVYKDFTLRETVDSGSVSITAYSQELPIEGTSYLGIETRAVDRFGHACLMVFCDKLVYIYVEKKDGTRLKPAQHVLPDGYPVYNMPQSDRIVKFESRDFNVAFDCPAGQLCKGPMYLYPNAGQKRCRDGHSDGSYRFNFAPFTKEPSLSLAVGSKNVYDKMMSWYPVSPAKKTFRSCFIKIQIKVENTYDLRIIMKSHFQTTTGREFGTYDAGPIPNPNSSDLSNRAACLEFRCPGYVKNGTTEIYDQPTVLTGRLVTANKTIKCKPSFKKTLNITTDADGKGFTFAAEAGNNYGYSYGVFVNDDDASKVNDFCSSGIDTGPKVDGVMNPNRNPAITFDCLI